MAKKKDNKFVWCSLRIAFWVTIGLSVILSILGLSYETAGEIFILILWITSAIFTFVVSIIHLTRFKKKAFAIVALVFSSLWILSIFIGFLIGFFNPIYGSEIIFEENNNFLEEGYFNSFSFNLFDYSYLSLDFNSNNFANIYLLEENEFYRYEEGESIYYLEASENSKSFSIGNELLYPGTYYVVVETTDEDIIYDISINSTLY